MKKIFLILIVILFSSSAFADHDKYKCSKKESILYGADKVLKERWGDNRIAFLYYNGFV